VNVTYLIPLDGTRSYYPSPCVGEDEHKERNQLRQSKTFYSKSRKLAAIFTQINVTMNLRTEISLLGMLTIETVLSTVYSSQPQRAFSSKSSLHNYRPLRFSRCSHAQQKVLLSSFSASDNVLLTYVLTAKRRGCQIFSTLCSGGGGPLADDRQVGLDRAPDLGFCPPQGRASALSSSGQGGMANQRTPSMHPPVRHPTRTKPDKAAGKL
jgi:hypothetical protein